MSHSLLTQRKRLPLKSILPYTRILMTKTVLFFRHGETEWNRIGRFQGHSDIPLNDTGIQQANELHGVLREFQPEIFFSSDLKRAKQTARLANRVLQKPHLIDPRLREVHLGQAEGLNKSEAEEIWGEQIIHDWANHSEETGHFRFPGGESKTESVQRVRIFLEDSLIHLPYKVVAVCGHGGTLRRLCFALSQTKDPQFPIPNCCIYRLAFDVVQRSWEEPILLSPL